MPASTSASPTPAIVPPTNGGGPSRSTAGRPPSWSPATTTRGSRQPFRDSSSGWLCTALANVLGSTPSRFSVTSGTAVTPPSGWPVTAPTPMQSGSISRYRPASSGTTPVGLPDRSARRPGPGRRLPPGGRSLVLPRDARQPRERHAGPPGGQDLRRGVRGTGRRSVRKYRARAKSRPDVDGYQRLQCPASGDHPIAACSLKPRSYDRRGPGVPVEIHPSKPLWDHPSACCRQETVTQAPWGGQSSGSPSPMGLPSGTGPTPRCATRSRVRTVSSRTGLRSRSGIRAGGGSTASRRRVCSWVYRPWRRTCGRSVRCSPRHRRNVATGRDDGPFRTRLFPPTRMSTGWSTSAPADRGQSTSTSTRS